MWDLGSGLHIRTTFQTQPAWHTSVGSLQLPMCDSFQVIHLSNSIVMLQGHQLFLSHGACDCVSQYPIMQVRKTLQDKVLKISPQHTSQHTSSLCQTVFRYLYVYIWGGASRISSKWKTVALKLLGSGLWPLSPCVPASLH